MKKRILAFVIAISMIFGDTVGAFADGIVNDVHSIESRNYSYDVSENEIASYGDSDDFDVSSDDSSLLKKDIPEDSNESEFIFDEESKLLEVSVSGNEPVEIHDGYIEDDLFLDSLSSYPIGYANSFDDSLLESKYINSNIPLTRNQSPYGSCWAHSALALGEINMIKKGEDSSINYSEAHLAYFAYNPGNDPLGGIKDTITNYVESGASIFDMGGNYTTASMALSSGVGARYESDFPYTSTASYSTSGISQSEKYGNNAAALKNAYMIDIIWDINKGIDNRDYVKRLVKEYGAVGVNMYYDEAYFNNSGTAFYNFFKKDHNHAVTIIGWDDNYSSTNFGSKPSTNGAWLVRNTYRAEQSFSETNLTRYTYFWISYESRDIMISNAVAYDFTNDEESIYDNNYQYDGAYGNGYTHFISHSVETGNITCANVFDVKACEAGEILKAVSFFTCNTNASYNIKIYSDLSDGKDPTSGTLVDEISDSFEFSGIYTVPLNSPVLLEYGTKYSVIITFSKPGSAAYASYEAGVTSTTYDSEGRKISYTSTSVSEAGQSFLYNNNWVDRGTNGNFRIKAFTDSIAETADPTAIQINNANNNSVDIAVNESFTVNTTVLPANASTKALTCSSSDTSIVTAQVVNGKIVLKGKALGQATVKISLKNFPDVFVNLNVNVISKDYYLDIGCSSSYSEPIVEYKNTISFSAKSMPSGADVTTWATWSSSNNNVLRFDEPGVATGVGIGKTVVSATYNGMTESGEVYVCGRIPDLEFSYDDQGDIIITWDDKYEEITTFKIQRSGDSAAQVVSLEPGQTKYRFVDSSHRNETAYDKKETYKISTMANGASYSLVSGFSKYVGPNYKIEYTIDHGENDPNNPTFYKYGWDYINLKSATPEEGYIFNGWYTDEAFKNRIYSVDRYSHENIHLYAKFTNQFYTVTFYPNSGSGTMSSQNIPIGVSTALLKNTYFKYNYEFAGWNTKEDGSGTSYSDEEEVYNLLTTHGGKINLYAQWQGAPRKILFDVNGGNALSSGQTTKTVRYSEKIGTLPTPTRYGYKFMGWYVDDKALSESDKCTFTTDKTAVAKWERIGTKVKVTFDLNGGDSWEGGSTATYSADAYADTIYGDLYGDIIPETKPVRNRHIFAGWSTEKTGINLIKESDRIVKNYDHSVYAQWSALTCNVEFQIASPNSISSGIILYDSYDAGENWKNRDYDSAFGELPIPTKSGYIFDGWYSANFTIRNGELNIDSSKKITATDLILAKDTQNDILTLYGRFVPCDNIITLRANEGYFYGNTEKTEESFIVKTDTAYGEMPVPVRTGYDFAGWYTDAVNGKTVTKTTKFVYGDTTTLFAHWSPKKYTVTFDINGGDSVDYLTKAYTYDSNFGSLPKASRYGYSFIGWTKDCDGKFPLIQGNTKVDFAEDIILYAQYTPVDVNVIRVWDGNGDGINDIDDKTVKFNDIIDELGTVQYSEEFMYVFDGWYDALEGGNRITSGYIVNSVEDIVLYPHWKEASAKAYVYDLAGNLYSTHDIYYNQPLGDIFANFNAGTGKKIDFWYYREDGTNGLSGDKFVDDNYFVVDKDYIVPLAKDIYIYAKTDIVNVKVVFKLNGGRFSETSDVLYNIPYSTKISDAITECLKTSAEDVEKPTRAKYDFAGWYIDVNDNRSLDSDDCLIIDEEGNVNELNDSVLTDDTTVTYILAAWNQSEDTLTVLPPEANITSGEIKSGTKVTLTTETPGAFIWYKLDDSDYKIYKDPVDISFISSDEIVLKAYAISEDHEKSAEASYTYSCESEDLWGDITEEDKEANGIMNVSDIPNGLWHTEIGTQYYRGAAVKLYDLRVFDRTTLLHENTDYSLSYKNNAKVGNATVTITFKGNYSGSMVENFTIESSDKSLVKISDCDIEINPDELIYDGNTKHPFIVENNGVTLVEGEDYVLSATICNARKYTVNIVGINDYTGSIAQTITILPRKIEDCSIDVYDVVTKVLADNDPISGEPVVYLSKGGAKPYMDIYEDDLHFALNTDYSLKFKNNTKPGAASVTINGKGNLTGSKTISFKVVGNIPSNRLTVSASDIVYSGKKNSFASKIAVLDVDGKALKAGTDYDKNVVYTYAEDVYLDNGTERISGSEVNSDDIVPVGAVINATVKFKGMYLGEETCAYRIVAGDISKASVSVLPQIYTGKPVMPGKNDITVKIGKTVLNPWEYDIVSYSDNIDKGNGKLTIKGIGNYGGEKTVSFAITQKNVLFTIRYDGNGADSGNVKNQSVKAGSSYKLTKNTYKKAGFTFAGWSLTPIEWSGENYTVPNPDDILPDMCISPFDDVNQAGVVKTLYAVWKPIEYSITYHTNAGANNDKNTIDTFVAGTPTFTLYAPEREDWPLGYYFDGWYTENTYKNRISQVRTGTVGNLNVYAKWIPYKYTVNFHVNGAKGSMASVSYSYDQVAKLPKMKLKSSAGAFVGWSVGEIDSAVVYNDGEEIVNLVSPCNNSRKSITLYAFWQNEFNILFEGYEYYNDSYTYGMSFKPNLPVLSGAECPMGYTFAGWYLDEKFTKKFSQISKTTSGDIILYPKFTANVGSVVFDGNENTGGKVKTISKVTDKFTVPACGFTRTGYVFDYWCDSADGSGKKYEVGKTVTNIKFSKKNEELVLYAIWKPADYSIAYDLVGGYIPTTDSNFLVSYQYGDSFELPTPIREEFMFAGWYKDASYKTKVTSITAKMTGDLHLYAKWSGTYTVRFDGNGATSGSMRDISKEVTGKLTLTSNSYKKSGYAFAGWAVSKSKADLKIVDFKDKAIISNPDFDEMSGNILTLYAVWRNTFTVSFDTNCDYEIDPIEYTYPYGVSDLSAYTCQISDLNMGYEFAGWYKDSKFKTKVENISTDSAEDITLYAKWKGKKYSVTYLPNGPDGKIASGTMKIQTGFVVGTPKALAKNAYKVKGYTFMGWSMNPFDTEATYLNSGKIEGSYGYDVVLYAIWQKDEYSITYVNMEDFVNSNVVSYSVDDEIFLEEPHKMGYTFQGWYSDKKFKKPVYGIPKGSTGKKTFYAKWDYNYKYGK